MNEEDLENVVDQLCAHLWTQVWFQVVNQVEVQVVNKVSSQIGNKVMLNLEQDQ